MAGTVRACWLPANFAACRTFALPAVPDVGGSINVGSPSILDPAATSPAVADVMRDFPARPASQ